MVGRGTGLRVDRTLTGGPQNAAGISERHDQRTSSPFPVLRRAVMACCSGIGAHATVQKHLIVLLGLSGLTPTAIGKAQ